jgi:hypothetical protein
LITTRNHASAMEILRLGLSLQAPTKSEVATCVPREASAFRRRRFSQR